jgi:hypothetical protein
MANMKKSEKVKLYLKNTFRNIGIFIFNKDTKEFFGRSLLNWGQLVLFFIILYIGLGAFFAIHLVVFINLMPVPGPGISPWNFGKYGYYNYPNAKLDLVAIPPSLLANGTHTSLIDEYKDEIDALKESANISGVTCINGSNINYGYHGNKACILLHINKVFEWTPQSLNNFIPTPINNNYMNITCQVMPDQNIQMTVHPPGIPLNLPNTNEGKSFPYNNQANYTVPLVGVELDFNNASITNITSSFDVEITCGIDLVSLGIANFSSTKLESIYELPRNVTFIVNFRNSAI